MTVNIECKHQHRQKNESAQIRRDVFPQASPQPDRASAALPPSRRFLHFRANVNHHKRRQRADHKHPTPTDKMKQGAVHQPRQQVAHDITFLQQPGEKSAIFFGQGLERQCGADAPLAAHRNSKQRPHDQKNVQRRSERGSELEHRIGDDIDHQRRTPAITIGNHPEQKRADRAHRQRQENSLGDCGNLCVKFRGNGADAKNQNEEIEGIQRPP